MSKRMVASIYYIGRRNCSSTSKVNDNWRHAWIAVVVVILTLQVASCTTIKPPVSLVGAEEPATRPSSTERSSFEREAHLKSIIDQAEAAFDANALTTPSNTSALHYYQKLLALRPDHPAAREGLRRIVDRYIAWALIAIDQGDYAKAHQFLERAASVNPKSPSIAAASEQIRRKREQATAIEIIPDWLMAEGSRHPVGENTDDINAASTYFLKIANKIEELSAKATIYSKTDRQGRWLYQQINAHTGERLRATLKIDTPSRIELHFKPQVDTIVPSTQAP